MITREGLCTRCRTKIDMQIPDEALDSNRFYWNQTILCPICNLTDVLMMKVVEK